MSEKTEDADITAFTKEERRNGWLMGIAAFIWLGLIVGMVVGGIANLLFYLIVLRWFGITTEEIFEGGTPGFFISGFVSISVMLGVATWIGVAIGKLRMRKERERRLQGNAGIEKA